MKSCEKCRHGVKNRINGVIYCHFWNHNFEANDICGQFEDDYLSGTIRILEIERECVIRQDTADCCRDELGCHCCDLVQDATDVIKAYDNAIEALKKLKGDRS